jgi:hypothetical protein
MISKKRSGGDGVSLGFGTSGNSGSSSGSDPMDSVKSREFHRNISPKSSLFSVSEQDKNELEKIKNYGCELVKQASTYEPYTPNTDIFIEGKEYVYAPKIEKLKNSYAEFGECLKINDYIRIGTFVGKIKEESNQQNSFLSRMTITKKNEYSIQGFKLKFKFNGGVEGEIVSKDIFNLEIYELKDEPPGVITIVNTTISFEKEF